MCTGLTWHVHEWGTGVHVQVSVVHERARVCMILVHEVVHEVCTILKFGNGMVTSQVGRRVAMCTDVHVLVRAFLS